MSATLAAVVATGGAYMLILRPYDRGDAPAGDAAALGRSDASTVPAGAAVE